MKTDDPIATLVRHRPLEDEWSPERREEARARLLAAIQAQPEPRAHGPQAATVRRRLVLTGVAAAVAAGLVIGVPLLSNETAPQASALSRLVATAAARPAVVIPDGKILHTKIGYVAAPPLHASSGTMDVWTDADGNGWSKSTVSSGASPGVSYGKSLAQQAAGTIQYSPAALSAMPTDPRALRAWFAARIGPMATRGAGDDGTGVSLDDAIFANARDMLRTGYAPPALSAAFLELVGKMANTNVTEADGMVRITHRSTTVGPATGALVFSADTAVLVGTIDFNGVDPAAPGGEQYRETFSPGELVDRVPAEVLQQAVLQMNEDTNVG